MSNDRNQRAARAEQMRKERDKAAKRERSIITSAIVVVVVALIGLAAFGVTKLSGDNAENTTLVAPKGATDDYGIEYTTADLAAADPSAAPATPATGEPVKVELYEDFQCPACRQFEAAYGDYLKQQLAAGAITIVYRPYSFLDRASSNQYSSRSTNVAMCVLEDSGVAKYADFHDYLYANQPDEGGAGPENPELIDAAEQIGLTNTSTFEQCVRTDKFGPWIEKARDEGSQREVTGTPTVFVDGKVVDLTKQDLRDAIDEAAKA